MKRRAVTVWNLARKVHSSNRCGSPVVVSLKGNGTYLRFPRARARSGPRPQLAFEMLPPACVVARRAPASSQVTESGRRFLPWLRHRSAGVAGLVYHSSGVAASVLSSARIAAQFRRTAAFPTATTRVAYRESRRSCEGTSVTCLGKPCTRHRTFGPPVGCLDRSPTEAGYTDTQSRVAHPRLVESLNHNCPCDAFHK